MLNNDSSTAGRIPPYVSEILRLIESSGHKAYVAGGAVRDIVLGKTPHDYDIATSAKPDGRYFRRRCRGYDLQGRRIVL